MSKIYIKAILKNENEVHVFEGKGIKNKNKITYNDDGVITKLTLGENITLERTSDYSIKMGFNMNENVKGTYSTKEGIFELETKTLDIKEKKDGIKIKYNLMINKEVIQTFEFYLQYTIDR